MQIRVDEISFASSNGRSLVKGWVYAPMEGDCKGIVQISHGMCEYIGRYDDFAGYMDDIQAYLDSQKETTKGRVKFL